MSGLVGYESSSDEETADQFEPKAVPLPKGHNDSKGAPNNVDDNAQPSEEQAPSAPTASSSDDLLGPCLGPAAQKNGPFVTEEEAVSPFTLADMSERDAIRHLTQATVPATSLPPSPPGSPVPAANERIRRFLELKAMGIHFNQDLARKTTFKNPSLLSTMMSKVGIDEKAQYNTSLPLDLWDTTDFPDSVYKEGLLKSQQNLEEQSEANKRMLSATGKRTIVFTSDSASGSSSRKSTPGHSTRRRP